MADGKRDGDGGHRPGDPARYYGGREHRDGVFVDVNLGGDGFGVNIGGVGVGVGYEQPAYEQPAVQAPLVMPVLEPDGTVQEIPVVAPLPPGVPPQNALYTMGQGPNGQQVLIPLGADAQLPPGQPVLAFNGQELVPTNNLGPNTDLNIGISGGLLVVENDNCRPWINVGAYRGGNDFGVFVQSYHDRRNDEYRSNGFDEGNRSRNDTSYGAPRQNRESNNEYPGYQGGEAPRPRGEGFGNETPYGAPRQQRSDAGYSEYQGETTARPRGDGLGNQTQYGVPKQTRQSDAGDSGYPGMTTPRPRNDGLGNETTFSQYGETPRQNRQGTGNIAGDGFGNDTTYETTRQTQTRQFSTDTPGDFNEQPHFAAAREAAASVRNMGVQYQSDEQSRTPTYTSTPRVEQERGEGQERQGGGQGRQGGGGGGGHRR